MRRLGRISAVLAVLPLAIWLAPVSAAQGQSHGAHTHGVGELNIAVDGARVDLELELPGSDTVGFEHFPSTNSEISAVEEAVKILKSPDKLFRFPKEAGCAGSVVSLESGLLEKHEGHGEHAEFHVEYRFTCRQADALKHVDVLVFEAFPATEEIEVMAITPSGQKHKELSPGSTRLAF